MSKDIEISQDIEIRQAKKLSQDIETTQGVIFLPKPLEDIMVLDFTRVLAGPYCTMILNDLGAEVIKVERPGSGDDARNFGPYINGKSAYFTSLNCGKKSVALDLKTSEDHSKALRLAARADVVVENFKPGTMEKLGLGYEDLKKVNRELIYAAISGFGHTGPDARKPAYDMIVQARGGIMSITGEPGGRPVRVGASIGDIAAGTFCAVGILAGLYQRPKLGEGSKVDVSMLDGQVAILENALARYLSTGIVPGPLGSRHPSITPFQAFKTRDDWVVIAAGNDKLWERFCQALKREDLCQDPRFISNQKRTENHKELEKILMAEIGEYKKENLLKLLEKFNVPATPINSVDQLLEDPQIQARNMLVRVQGEGFEDFVVAGNPIKIDSFQEEQEKQGAPEIGEHNQEVFAEYLEADDGQDRKRGQDKKV